MLTPDTITELNTRIARADAKYGPLRSQAECLGALNLELWEVMDAMHARDAVNVRAELLDVATVALRYVQGDANA